jgi:hypothetical protein
MDGCAVDATHRGHVKSAPRHPRTRWSVSPPIKCLPR